MSETPTPFFEPDSLEVAVAAAMSRQHAEDARAFLRGLADFLLEALPGEVRVTRQGLFGGDKRPVKRIEIAFAENAGAKTTRYTLEDSGAGPLSAFQTQIVREVALKTEGVEAHEWITAVVAAIARRAEGNRATRDALKRLL